MQSSGVNKQLLLSLLEENEGKLGNIKARRLISTRYGTDITDEQYEQLKEQLFAEGLIKKGRGQGGTIELIPSESDPKPEKQKVKGRARGEVSAGTQEAIDTLFNSLIHLPGLVPKKNRQTITILCGDDNDKLYCGWHDEKGVYYVQYRAENGREDYTDLAIRLFEKASTDVPGSDIQQYFNATTLYLDSNVAQANRVVRRLMSLLDDVTLDNAPQRTEAPTKPRPERYYLEVATIIKFCVDSQIEWPLKNWRATLGFDDVDDLIVIGSSPSGAVERRREHVVPASLIYKEARKLAEMGAPEQAIADFIRHHLYVVYVSQKEAELLDRPLDSGGLSLKTSMPEGWVIGCDPLDRLKQAGIPVAFTEPIPLPEWKPWKKASIRDKIRRVLNTPVIRV